MTTKMSSEEIKAAVRTHYSEAIKTQGSCCAPTPIRLDEDSAGRFVEMAGYTPQELAEIPEGVTSFGCGNPLNFINVKPGETVLDLGSGAGLDLILASKKVGPEGKVIGLDMTPDMIDVCKSNLTRANVTNTEVLLGEMEAMPVGDSQIDWVISNCVINLSPEKEKVFAEIFRVLKPGGQIMVSDIVTIDLPDAFRDDMAAWAGCIAGAVSEDDYVAMVKAAGFSDVKVIDKLTYDGKSLNVLAAGDCGCGSDKKELDSSMVDKYANRVASIKLSARKP